MYASIFSRELRKTFCYLFNAAKISYANEEIDSIDTHLIAKHIRNQHCSHCHLPLMNCTIHIR